MYFYTNENKLNENHGPLQYSYIIIISSDVPTQFNFRLSTNDNVVTMSYDKSTGVAIGFGTAIKHIFIIILIIL